MAIVFHNKVLTLLIHYHHNIKPAHSVPHEKNIIFRTLSVAAVFVRRLDGSDPQSKRSCQP